MAVSSVFPPSASPTEGDDPCETDVTSVAIHNVTLLICLCGLAGNGALFCLLRWKGHTACIFGLAVADFLFLLFAVPSALLFLLEDVSCSPILPLMYVSFLYLVSVVSCYWALFWMTAISAKKDMKKLCKLCCHCDLPDPMMWVLWGAQCLAFFALFIAIPTVTYLCPSHEQEHCQVALTSMFTVILLLFAAPMVITRTIDIIKAKCGSQQQCPKRFHIVIFLLVLLALLLILLNFLQHLGYTVVSSQVVFLLACIHSTIKPFIYFLAGRCWSPCSVGSLRLSLQRVFEETERQKCPQQGYQQGHGGSEPVEPFPCAAEEPRDSD
ncbi:mas-related G-protein coupled receptor member H-like [Corvus hawaiiensis]|uniref:mas-related G-protein coupled receptor member H-like n=1 Tax=Corvus hawaiiensis TaxID=134902 RepID=UPI002018CC1F|nr:mas-related G-protein coupled receptor member H-like [Corvus hawaiiensis]